MGIRPIKSMIMLIMKIMTAVERFSDMISTQTIPTGTTSFMVTTLKLFSSC